MKTWKLVSGIISIVLFAFVMFQSCAAGISNSLAENGESGGSAGLIVAIILLAGGIVSIATRNGSKGGNIALIVLFALGALCGFTMAGSYADLNFGLDPRICLHHSFLFMCFEHAFQCLLMLIYDFISSGSRLFHGSFPDM